MLLSFCFDAVRLIFMQSLKKAYLKLNVWFFFHLPSFCKKYLILHIKTCALYSGVLNSLWITATSLEILFAYHTITNSSKKIQKGNNLLQPLIGTMFAWPMSQTEKIGICSQFLELQGSWLLTRWFCLVKHWLQHTKLGLDSVSEAIWTPGPHIIIIFFLFWSLDLHLSQWLNPLTDFLCSADWLFTCFFTCQSKITGYTFVMLTVEMFVENQLLSKYIFILIL